ncbi:DUF2863 family protein [Polynucleobacter sp. MWH-Loch1C5]|uniref:DUF2863 family protein n=1 Tax=Polynucleobacter sp. MWH-Loch1C5 TaxID=2689108 RepID=UPI001C0A9F56|nr:DUF2863 family protein [Polynucleobacter sp. MWH-Loch1C5]MBU3543140.1 DUF2863 family protein [Polynucleobacter sp. MWH-Loch1C5]
MPKFRAKNPPRISPEAERLIADALSLAASGSRVEDIYWEARILERLIKLLHAQNQNAIDSALEQTLKINPIAYDALAENAETLAESMTLEFNGQTWDALLLAIPIVAHTRYNIPSGKLSANSITAMGNLLHEAIIADGSRIALIPWLYSIDQMPHSHCQTRQLLEQLAAAAIGGGEIKMELRNMPETIPVLADPRYVVGVVASPAGQALFRWQEDGPRRQERSVALTQWQSGIAETIAAFLPGCEFELALPEAYFTNCRESDRKVRPLSIVAAINYLESVLNVSRKQLTVIVAGFGEEECDEYRIGFGLKGQKEILYGVVWPLYDREMVSNDALSDVSIEDSPIREIYDTLKAAGIEDHFRHSTLFAPEMCEDCGVPMFADRSGEIVHAEMPEDLPAQEPLFH